MKAKLVLPTSVEVEKIKHCNREIINRFYLLNYDYLTMLAKKYCYRVVGFRDWQDLVQEIYLYFDKFEFDNPAYFGRCAFKVFSNYRYGGQRKKEQLKDSKYGEEYYLLDEPIKGKEKDVGTLGESIVSEFEIVEEIEPRPDISENLYKYLCGYLSKERKRVFTQFYWTGKTYNEISRELCKNPRTVKRTREDIFKKFRSNADNIKKWLYAVGYYEIV